MNKPLFVSFTMCIVAVVNFILNIVLIPKIGLEGAAWANTAGLLIGAVIFNIAFDVILKEKVYNISYSLKLGKILFLILLVTLISKIIEIKFHSIILMFVCFAVFTLLYFILLEKFNLFNIRNTIKEIVKK